MSQEPAPASYEQTLTLAAIHAGMGIPEEVLPQLFEPFFTTKHDGSGLGLAISHEIIAEHGGTLTATSRPRGGAIFHVRLPLVPIVGKP